MDADDDVAFQFNDTATTLKGNKDTNSNETGMKSDGHDSETSRTRDLCYSFQTFALDCNNGRTDGRRGPGGGGVASSFSSSPIESAGRRAASNT